MEVVLISEVPLSWLRTGDKCPLYGDCPYFRGSTVSWLRTGDKCPLHGGYSYLRGSTVLIGYRRHGGCPYFRGSIILVYIGHSLVSVHSQLELP